jgi:hypothetical protein
MSEETKEIYIDYKTIDIRPQYELWAPGSYICKCNKCKNTFTGDKRALWCADCAYTKKHLDEIKQEKEELLAVAEEAVEEILSNKTRLEKHGTYSWLDETIGRHLLKSSRHAQTNYFHVVEGDPEDGENHIDMAIVRLLMAKALQKRKEKE